MRRSPFLILLAVIVAGAGTAAAADSPMKAWMKSQMGAPRAANDFPALFKAFEKVAADVPDPSWTEWAPIARKGAEAAKEKDMRGVKDSCKVCHDKYKDAYKEKFASRAPPK